MIIFKESNFLRINQIVKWYKYQGRNMKLYNKLNINLLYILEILFMSIYLKKGKQIFKEMDEFLYLI